jgi:beta-N-acetylhexosaminidase
MVLAGLACAASTPALLSFHAEPSLDLMIGQMLMLGFVGTSSAEEWPQQLAQQIRAGQVGGVIMLGRNFKDRDGTLSLTELFRNAAAGPPALIALDQEGGLVQRLGARLGYSALPSAETIGRVMSENQAGQIFDAIATMVREAGFNVNLAPVVDLAVDPQNEAVVSTHRTYGENPQIVTRYARAFVAAQREQGILSVLKHFPGHGSSRRDSHDGLADITSTWSNKELDTFRALINEGYADAVMTGHLVLRSMDPLGVPVSLSKSAVTGVLRGELGFSGLIFSDDLQMAAIREQYGGDESIVMAINAGVDILMFAHPESPEFPLAVIGTIKKAIADGRISKRTIESAWRRIESAKQELQAGQAQKLSGLKRAVEGKP